MIHPYTTLQFVNSHIGNGVFATADIPKGTIVYVKDCLEIELPESAFNTLDHLHQGIVDKYSYIDEKGIRILSWDNAKYVNHRCNCNTISTGYGFEIAIRDIFEGEEICDEYGLFNIDQEIPLACNCPNCRKVLRPDDIDNYYHVWDKWVASALEKAQYVSQPLMEYMCKDTRSSLQAYFEGQEAYRSVLALKWQRDLATAI
ncbi:SET domain-containing protein [Desulfovibrio ferrophilus]|uniref:SET domain-containing protein n=1 Tax=Desulfovibrio ferrophilus TaxID=241368 RepID=A0A2Z6AWB8_9BACT|nr:SET domain-containing protein [Desulfovibrio ferrophilus]BBD07544.1 putative uncharacterized protein [Desulfovibrio ferrophilus]